MLTASLVRRTMLNTELLLQVTLQTWFFLSYLMDSLAIAANGLVADSLGRGDIATARGAALRCLLYGGGVSVALLAVLGTFPQGVSAIFTDSRCASVCCISRLDTCAADHMQRASAFAGSLPSSFLSSLQP
jgi:hypothetical protein